MLAKTQIFYTSLLVAVMVFGVSNIAFADHEAAVAGQVVPLADASLSHGENCDDVHYHGELNGVADPDPDGCGHGVVSILEHDENDESIVPVPETEEQDSPSTWGRFTDWLDALFQGVSGGFSPKTVSDSVDIVEDATPSIGENVDNIEEYRESVNEDEDTLNFYNDPSDGLEEGSLSQRFFRWFNSLVD